jgi:copper(I)-binding protein
LNEEAFALIRASSGKTAAGRLLLGAGVLALLIPAIAGCEAGNGAPTLEFHSASSGAQAVVNGIRITNMFVLGAPAGSTLPSGSSASLFLSIYNGGTSSDTLESVSAPGWASSVTLSGGPVALPANAAPVNLTGPHPEVVLENLSRPLRGGSILSVTLVFAHAGTVTDVPVPIEPQSFQWATFAPPAITASPASSATPTATATGAATASPTGTATASPTGTATASPTGTATASPTAS